MTKPVLQRNTLVIQSGCHGSFLGLYNSIPMNPSIGTVELTGKELLEMLEENLERTLAADQYEQMGGYVKRGLGLTVYMKIENPAGQRIQQIFIGNKPLSLSRIYHVAFVTSRHLCRRIKIPHTRRHDRS